MVLVVRVLVGDGVVFVSCCVSCCYCERAFSVSG